MNIFVIGHGLHSVAGKKSESSCNASRVLHFSASFVMKSSKVQKTSLSPMC